MADPHAHDDYVRGSQEISEQVSTFHLFMNLAKWGSVLMGAVVAFLTIWFMPGNGSFIGGAATAVVILAAGWWFLLRQPKSAH